VGVGFVRLFSSDLASCLKVSSRVFLIFPGSGQKPARPKARRTEARQEGSKARQGEVKSPPREIRKPPSDDAG